MTTKTKVIVGVCVALLILGLLFVLALVGIGLYVASDKEGAKQYSDALAKGPEFGKKTDQMGCLREGFARLESVSQPSISQLTANDVFVRECLGASRPNAGFCDRVPLLPYSGWIEGECDKMGRIDAVCRGVFDAKHTFCNGL